MFHNNKTIIIFLLSFEHKLDFLSTNFDIKFDKTQWGQFKLQFNCKTTGNELEIDMEIDSNTIFIFFKKIFYKGITMYKIE